jgi:TATA-box binding protein (TBP) (component of TFIID and TFIIIB)
MKKRSEGREPWQDTLDAILEDPELPLRKRKVDDSHFPYIVNMVSTVSLMPAGAKLPLETLATYLGPCSQYAPKQFAANIFKLGDSTGLLFSSGKLLLTAALTKMHVLFASHYFRLCIESVPYRSQPWKHGPAAAAFTRLETTFNDLSIHNIVGHGNFYFAVDLERLRNTYPDLIEWVPDNFPAARCKVWVHADQRCHCGFDQHQEEEQQQQQQEAAIVKHLKRKCRCIIKCLVFANGSIVMIGGKATDNVNYVFFHMKHLCKNPQPAARLKTPLLLRLPDTAEKHKEKPKDYISPETAIALALAAAHDFKDKTRIKTLPPMGPNEQSILMYLADAGRLEAVRYALAMEPEQLLQLDAKGRTVIERLRSLQQRTPQQEAVLAFLENTTH